MANCDWQVRKAFFEAARDCYTANGRITDWIADTSPQCRRDVCISATTLFLFKLKFRLYSY